MAELPKRPAFSFETTLLQKPVSFPLSANQKGGFFCEISGRKAGLASGDAVVFEGVGVQAMRLVVMSPLEQGVKLTDLEIQQDWTVGLGEASFCGAYFFGFG